MVLPQRRALAVLAAAAQRHPHVQARLFALLGEHPGLVGQATAEVIQLVTAKAPISLADRVDRALPRFSTDLLRPARDLARRLLDDLPPDATPAQRATRLTTLGVRLSALGERQAALDPTREAVAIRRRLAEAEPAAYLPNLAMALWGFAWVRADGGLELQEALQTVEEAIALYKELTETLPDAFAGYLDAAEHTRTQVLDALGGDHGASP